MMPGAAGPVTRVADGTGEANVAPVMALTVVLRTFSRFFPPLTAAG